MNLPTSRETDFLSIYELSKQLKQNGFRMDFYSRISEVLSLVLSNK